MLTNGITVEEIIRNLNGLTCWAVTAGVGSRIVLDFGRKIKRDVPIKNMLISEASRIYKGEFSIFIEDCSWRLEKESLILCSSKSDRGVNDSLRLIVGKKIINASVLTPGYDLTLEFDEKICFRSFSDCIWPETDGDNYTLFAPDRTMTIGAKGQLKGTGN